MIRVIIRCGNNESYLNFPCTDSELQKDVEKLQPGNSEDLNLFVTKVLYPEGMGALEGQFVNMDELNYLGRRLAGFWGDEPPRFEEALKFEGATTVREMINIACDIERYALIDKLSDLSQVGREYVLQTEGSLRDCAPDDPQYAELAGQLLRSQRGIITEQGILFVNTERPLQQQYTGSTFPAYLDDPNCLMIAEISYNGQTEYVNLPAETLSLDKAIHRLGASDVGVCAVALDHMNTQPSAFRDVCEKTLQSDGIYTLNRWCGQICDLVSVENHMVFDAAFSASSLETMSDAIKVAENVDSFYFAKGVKNEAELGKWWLEHYSQFTISPELQQFFDYKAYGEYLSQFLDVHYLESGDCVFLDGTTMDEVLGIEPTEDMGMGGID